MRYGDREYGDSVSVAFTRRVANKSLRYMDGYRKGTTGRLAAFVDKKYTSHRCLPGSWLTECIDEYKAAFGETVEESMVDVDAIGKELAALDGESVTATEDPGEEDGGEEDGGAGDK
jgi:hypothetical protein